MKHLNPLAVSSPTSLSFIWLMYKEIELIDAMLDVPIHDMGRTFGRYQAISGGSLQNDIVPASVLHSVT